MVLQKYFVRMDSTYGLLYARDERMDGKRDWPEGDYAFSQKCFCPPVTHHEITFRVNRTPYLGLLLYLTL